MATLLVGLSTRNVSADNETWLGNYNNDWDSLNNMGTGPANWQGYYAPAEVPLYYDNAIFSAQSPNMTLTFSQAANGSTRVNNPAVILFENNGLGYTLGSLTGPTAANGLYFSDSTGLFMQSTLVGNGGSETIDAPIEAQSRFIIGNFSPTSPEPSIPGVAGYNNTFVFNGNITGDNSSTVTFLGTGNINVNGNIIGANGYNVVEDSMATVTLSGTNSYTGYTYVGGTLNLDYTTNNTNKINTTNNLNIGYNGNGGHLVVTGNDSATTVQDTGNVYARAGANSITVNGGTGATATLNLGFIYTSGPGATIDFSNNSGGTITTLSGNNDIYGDSITIIGEYATYDQMYWATANQPGQSANGSDYAIYLANGGTPTSATIAGLTVDDGDSFTNYYANYTVDAGGETLDPTNPDGENANTIRFGSAGGGTLDLGGGTLNLNYSGILVAKNVTGDTMITGGNIATNGAVGGLDIYNYGTGTLTFAANLTNNINIAKSGMGDVIISGDNSAIHGAAIVINQGKLIVGSATALGADTYTGAPAYGIGNVIDFGDGTATLDLNGYNTFVAGLNSNNDLLPGNAAAAAGLNSQIINSKAGTLSRITIEGNSNINPANNNGAVDGATYGFDNLGQYTGGINEVSGSIISLDIEQGTATAPVQFNFGPSNPFGDPTGANWTNAVSGLTGYATEFTGSVTIGQGAILGLTGYSNVQTLGVTTLNGEMGGEAQQDASYGTTYLTGTGAIVFGYSNWNFDLNLSGSVTDTFAGNFGTAADQADMGLLIAGTGSATFIHAIDDGGVNTYGTSHLTMDSLNNNTGLDVNGESSITITGTSGTVAGGTITLDGGRLNISPSGSGADVTVNSLGSQLNFDDEGTLILDKGANTSLTFQMGSSNNGGFNFNGTNQSPDLVIGSAQGIAALGTTDKFVILTNAGVSPINQVDGIVSINTNGAQEGAFAQNDTVGGPMDATFLAYDGTGTAGDVGFVGYTFEAGNTNNINASTDTSVELITDSTESIAANTQIQAYGLQVDKGGVLNFGSNASLLLGNYSDTFLGEVILNGGTINGTVILNTTSQIYTDLDNGTIAVLETNNRDLAKDGPGTLFITDFENGGGGRVIVNGGALDVGAKISSMAENSTTYLHGGVIQGSGSYNPILAEITGGLVFNTNNDYASSLGGGFSARGGNLDVDLLDPTTNASANLVWGGTANFLQKGGVLDFGSLTSDNTVAFYNNVDLGPTGNGDSLYDRVINVTANSSDTGDPMLYADATLMFGVISSNTDSYSGLSKDGTGVLYLLGVNTYTGSTTIARGTLVIEADSGLGTAPTAAYALNTTPDGGIAGAAQTPGSVVIDGGAALAYDGFNGAITLNANRQILLASGVNGEDPSIIDVNDGSAADVSGGSLSFGGIIADYVGEVGSLQKQGTGLFNYSGTSYNTGTDSVVAGTFEVSGGGSVNSVQGVTINNQTATSAATFNYSSTVGLTKTVTYGANGGNFAYNSQAAYTGSPSLQVGSKDILSGSGNLSATAVTIASGGTLLPGQADPTPGTLTLGATTFLSGGNDNFLIADADGIAGTGYNTVVATSLDISSLSAGGPFNINLESLTGDLPGDAANFDPTQSYSFTLVSTTNGIGGTFASDEFDVLTGPNNGTTGFSNIATGTWTVSESGNDLVLNYTPGEAPEPSTYALLGLGLAALAFINRFRKLRALSR